MSPPPFQTLLDRHGRDVHRFLIALVGRQEADDCYQETWLAALRAYPTVRDTHNLRGWVLTIAHRKALDHFRAGARRPMPSDALPEPSPGPGPDPDPDPSPGAASGPRHDLHDGVWTSVRALPEKQRGAVALRYLLDAGYPEIARALGCSEDAARRSVHEGLKRLRKEIAA